MGTLILLCEGRRTWLTVGDITRVPAGAIVNAANSALAGGGGVDGAIHRAGGPAIMRELNLIRMDAGGCPAGSAPRALGISCGGAGVFAGGAGKRNCWPLTFPSISTGAYRYPIAEAARVAVDVVVSHLEREETAQVHYRASPPAVWAVPNPL